MELDSGQKLLSFKLDYLPDFIVQKAKEELSETEEEKKKCLKSLRILLKGENRLNANLDSEFLLQFLRCKKFNCQKALEQIKSFYKYRQKYSFIYENFSPSKLLLEKNFDHLEFLPYRTQDGCPIYVIHYGQWDSDVYTYEENTKVGLMHLHLALQSECTQISGIAAILNFESFSYKKFLQFTLQRIKYTISAVQDCLPFRVKAIHVVNESPFCTFMHNIAKPMWKEKIRNRIYFHGHNMKSLHCHFPPEILPERFGGYLKPTDICNFRDELAELEDHFIQSLRYGYV